MLSVLLALNICSVAQSVEWRSFEGRSLRQYLCLVDLKRKCNLKTGERVKSDLEVKGSR